MYYLMHESQCRSGEAADPVISFYQLVPCFSRCMLTSFRKYGNVPDNNEQNSNNVPRMRVLVLHTAVNSCVANKSVLSYLNNNYKFLIYTEIFD